MSVSGAKRPPRRTGSSSVQCLRRTHEEERVGTGGEFAAVGGSASPTSLLTYGGPVSNDQVTLSFQQAIDANEALIWRSVCQPGSSVDVLWSPRAGRWRGGTSGRSSVIDCGVRLIFEGSYLKTRCSSRLAV